MTTDPQQIRAIADGATLYGVMGLSLVGVDTIDDGLTKHLMDVTPAFTFAKVASVGPARVPGRGGSKAPARPAPKPVLPATGVAMLPQAWMLIAAAGSLGVWTRRRRF